MKVCAILALVCAAVFQVAGMVGKGLGSQQAATAAASLVYQQEAP